ncbi:hypothetical protein [Snuella sedimenti]|uniref:Uncharacterized protein n=1 Tax=Snuella sedimenti TaxID=2798802 RepID=A0A8J7LYQ5_9FLAO|nr:hypothetical protein [Snuella sedimenti]MBJ6368816.1 hypothetical protein [Snuella sedimenti]
MKKLVLFFSGLLMSITTITALETTNLNHEKPSDISKRYSYAQPIAFMERGIAFLIFPDGSFDFNTHSDEHFYNDYYRNNTRRNVINATYRGPHVNINYSSTNTRGVFISRDRYGKIRRIGNVYLNYSRNGKITRVGNVFLKYNRGNGLLKQVGNLHVRYNHWGEIVNIRGQVNHYNNNCNACGMLSCTTDHNHDHGYYNNSNWNDNYDADDHYYYYKQNGKVKKHKKNKR